MIYGGDIKVKRDTVENLMEIGNVGMGKATAILGRMLNSRILIDISNVIAISTEEIEKVIDCEDEMVGVLLPFTKDISGIILFVVKKDFAEKLLHELVDEEEFNRTVSEVNEDYVSHIKEVADVMSQAYLSAVSKYTGFEIDHSPVMICIDKISDMLIYPFSHIRSFDVESYCVESKFSICNSEMKCEDLGAQGHILFFPDNLSLEKIIRELESF